MPKTATITAQMQPPNRPIPTEKPLILRQLHGGICLCRRKIVILQRKKKQAIFGRIIYDTGE
jgi:hypothetical protein